MSELYDIDKWMIGWNSPRDGKPESVRVGPRPDRQRWSQDYDRTAGCCNSQWHELTPDEKMRDLVTGFLFLVLGEGLDPQAVHREFLKIEGYQELEASFFGMGPHLMFQNGQCSPYKP